MVEPVWAVENDRKTLLRIMASLVSMAGASARSLPLAGVRVRSAAGRLKAPVELSKGSNARSPSDGPEARVPGGGESQVCQRQIGSSGGASKGLERPEPKRRAGEAQTESPRKTLPRFLYRTLLKLLRPAEYAARRLLIAFSRDIKVPPPRLRPEKPQPVIRDGFGNPIVLPDGVRISGHLYRTSGKPIRISGPSGKTASGSPRKRTLPLFDPLPRCDGRPVVIRTAQPRIWVQGVTDRRPIPPRPRATDPVDATRLWLRIDAVVAALTDFEAHATRFARWRERTRLALAQGKRVKRIDPLRPGRLPGAGSARTREVHDLLKHTQQFAYYALVYPDDS